MAEVARHCLAGFVHHGHNRDRVRRPQSVGNIESYTVRIEYGLITGRSPTPLVCRVSIFAEMTLNHSPQTLR
jgi:hypothetical protein